MNSSTSREYLLPPPLSLPTSPSPPPPRVHCINTRQLGASIHPISLISHPFPIPLSLSLSAHTQFSIPPFSYLHKSAPLTSSLPPILSALMCIFLLRPSLMDLLPTPSSLVAKHFVFRLCFPLVSCWSKAKSLPHPISPHFSLHSIGASPTGLLSLPPSNQT